MLEKVVAHTVEKHSQRRINMVVIRPDTREFHPDFLHVLFATEKPNTYGRSLLPCKRDIISTKAYRILGVDLYYDKSHRYVDVTLLEQEAAWKRVTLWCKMFIKSASSFSGSSTSSGTQLKLYDSRWASLSTNSVNKGGYDVKINKKISNAVLVTNNKQFANS